jgi:hypothetical protein
MLKYKNNCKVCITAKAEKNNKLIKLIYESNYFMPRSDYSLSEVHRQYEGQFNYRALLNHVKKHQFLDQKDFERREMNRIAKTASGKAAMQRFENVDVWNEVMTQGMEDLKKGKIQLTANHLLKATKDRTDFELKKTDQQLAMMEMIYHFASGENSENKQYDRRVIGPEDLTNKRSAVPTPGDIIEVEDGPGDIHNGDAGDAVTRWPSSLLTRNNPA